jgi:cytochrome c peroxidase
MLDNNDTLIVIFGIAIIGLTALLLVANELGKRNGLALPGRLALVGGLGLGVFAFSIKAMLALFLNSLQEGEIASLRTIKIFEQPKVEQTSKFFSSAQGIWQWHALPLRAPEPSNNKSTQAKIDLGRKLFFDTRLSADGTLSCASCHDIGAGGDDNASFSTGIHGQTGDRNAPTVLNAAFLSRLFWDGRAASLEDQAKGPLVNPVEMGMPSEQAVVDKVKSLAEYGVPFRQTFPGEDPITIDTIAAAIAAFERTLITPNAPYDRFVRGDESALTPQQIRGMALFQEVGCRNCHLDPTFSSAGLVKPFGTYRTFPTYPDNPYVKKYNLLIDGKPAAIRVPSLRNVALTAPYFHNGSVKELEEAVRVMAVSQLGRPLSNSMSDDLKVSWPHTTDKVKLNVSYNRVISDSDVNDIAAFLRSLTATKLPVQKK